MINNGAIDDDDGDDDGDDNDNNKYNYEFLNLLISDDLILKIQIQISLLSGNLYLTDLVRNKIIKFDIQVYC